MKIKTKSTQKNQKKLPPIAYILMVGISIIGVKFFLPFFTSIFTPTSSTSACDFEIGDNLSCGEESIFQNINSLKQEGIDAYKKKDYALAASKFEQSFKQDNDPESLIYYQDSNILSKLKPDEFFTLAVAIPLGQNTDNLSQAILKASAQYQEEYNKNNKKKMLILIVNDGNNIDNGTAQKVAKKLVQKKEHLVAVIGHYASRVSLTVKPIYDRQLVFLSAHSMSSELTNKGNDTWFFRVSNTTEVQATNLINYLKKQGHKKVGLFVSPRAFSASFYDDFTSYWQTLGSDYKIVKYGKLEDNSNISDDINEAKNKGATAIAICPDVNVNQKQRENVTEILTNNHGMLITGCNTLYNSFYIDDAQRDIDQGTLDLGVSLNVFPDDNTIKNKYQELWGDKEADFVRYALSYDAIKTVADGVNKLIQLNKPINTIELQKILADNFKTDGITGAITLRGSERVENTGVIVKRCKSTENCDWQKRQ